MPKPGLVVEVQNPEVQTHLTADAAAAATVLTVESTHQFNNELGDMVAVSDQDPIEVDSTTETTITLASGLPAAADDGDPVSLVRGGQRATFWDAEVSFGEEETVPVPIGFDQREKWPPGTYDPPIPVMVADDLSVILDAPGRTPVIDGQLVWNPHVARQATSQTIPNNSFTPITSWTTLAADGIGVSGASAIVQSDGFYDIRTQVVFEVDSIDPIGRRRARILVNGAQVAHIALPADDVLSTYLNTSTAIELSAGDEVVVDVHQSSGMSLALIVGSGFTNFSMYRVSV